MQCDQLVTIDNCCNPSQCANHAAWQHAPSGLALCVQHHGNAVKYVLDGTWNVGGKQVSFPEGWAAIEVPDSAVTSELAPAEAVRASGLIIETGTLSPSGLYIER